MTGLPWQAVHDGTRFQHEPVRLTVVIEASRSAVDGILSRHAGVRDLVTKGWICLVIREGTQAFRLTPQGSWQAA